jgi:hypothetical protein
MKPITKITTILGGFLVLGIASTAQAWGVGLSFHATTDDTLCVDAKGDGKGAGTKVQIYKCNNTEAQRWALSRTTDDWSEIIGPGGLCVADKENAKNAYMYGCTFKDNQLWKHVDGQLKHKSSGKCLSADSIAEGQALTLIDCDKGAVKWKFKQE